MLRSPKTVRIFDVAINNLTKNGFLHVFQTNLRNGKRMRIGYVNIYGLNLACERYSFREALRDFNFIICDGFGVMLGARLTGQIIPERFTPPDFIDEMMSILRAQAGGVFLLGAAPGVAERAAQTLQTRTPGLQIAGCMHGYFDKAPNSPENQAVLEKINTARPALLLVAFGMPAQEEWLHQNWPDLRVQMALTVGALFDTLSGDIPRAPRWVTDRGLEWLARLLVEPRRLWRRYLIGNPLFFWRIVVYHWLKISQRVK